MPLILLLARLGLGITLLISGAAKATGRLKFEQSLYTFGFVPVAIVRAMSFAVPSTELLLGLMLILGLFARESAIATAFLISTFSVGVILNLLENRRIECGCFGSFSEKPISWWTVGRNLILVAGAALIAILGGGMFSF